MFKIDQSQNRITPIQARRFGELGFAERKHLQEWLEHCPQALIQDEGAELLIIQKEFNGFNDTGERLDLLALDKEGNLVVIENKLDDTGRDVVWQALQYASYCASLSKPQVVNIYQGYLTQKAQQTGEKPARAEDRLIEFFEVDDLDVVQLNRIGSQRLMLVADHYRKEVISTALWLRQFGIACLCFKVTPYQAGAELFLNVKQILPTPESSEFMIGMATKEAEGKNADQEQKQRRFLRMEFWGQVLEAFYQSDCTLYNYVSESEDHRLSAYSEFPSVSYLLTFGRQEIRVALDIDRFNDDESRFTFDRLSQQKADIEARFGTALEWLPPPEKKYCRIQYSKPVDGYNRDNWPEMIQWLVLHMTRLEQAMREPLKGIRSQLRLHKNMPEPTNTRQTNWQ